MNTVTRPIIVNGIKKGELTLPASTSEEEWTRQLSYYRQNSSLQKVKIMHNFNVDFKIMFVAENIDLGISTWTPPEGYVSMREFAKVQLSDIYSDMLDFSYPEALAKLTAKQAEADLHPEWAPIITRERLEKAKTEILQMLGSL